MTLVLATESNPNLPASTRDEQRRQRQVRRNRKLLGSLRDLVTAHGGRYIGPNALVESFAGELGFASHQLAIADVGFQKLFTIICVPYVAWRQHGNIQRLVELKKQARAVGFKAILVPQGVAEREPRLGNARLICQASHVRSDATSRMTVLAQVCEHGPTNLGVLASLVRHRNPYGVILRMVASGDLTADLSRQLTPSSLLHIAGPIHGVTLVGKNAGLLPKLDVAVDEEPEPEPIPEIAPTPGIEDRHRATGR